LSILQSKRIKLFASISFILSIFIISTFLFLSNAGTWLLISDSIPKRLDLIFTFAGENVRDSYSRELMQKFPNAHWLMSDYKEGYNRILRRENYDMSRVSIVDTCTNTLSEVKTLTMWINQNTSSLYSHDSVIYVGLVSGPYHMRRIEMMINKNLPQQHVHFFYLPVPLDRYKWTYSTFKKWWESSSISEIVISEIKKIFYFFLIS
jgi:hypothetical protein